MLTVVKKKPQWLISQGCITNKIFNKGNGCVKNLPRYEYSGFYICIWFSESENIRYCILFDFDGHLLWNVKLLFESIKVVLVMFLFVFH